jgi:hypothetical protein
VHESLQKHLINLFLLKKPKRCGQKISLDFCMFADYLHKKLAKLPFHVGDSCEEGFPVHGTGGNVALNGLAGRQLVPSPGSVSLSVGKPLFDQLIRARRH